MRLGKSNYLCVPAISTDGVDRAKNVVKLATDYSRHSSVTKRLSPGQIKSSFARYFKQATKKSLFAGEAYVPTVEELKRMYKYANKGMKDLNRGDLSEFQKGMWLPHEMVTRSPELNYWYKRENTIRGRHKGNSTKLNNSLHTISTKLKAAAGQSGFSQLLGGVTKPAAVKHIDNIERGIREAHRAEDWGTRDALMKELDSYYKEGEGKVFSDFYELATNGKANPQDVSPEVRAAVKTWRQEMKPVLDRAILNGMDSYFWGFKNLAGKLTHQKSFSSSLRKVELVRDAVRDYIRNPDAKHDFPVRMLDIMPTLGKAHELYNKRKAEPEDYLEAENLLSNLVKNVDMDLSIASTLYKSPKQGTVESKNILPILDAYSRSVARFEMVGASTQNMLESIHKITNKKSKSDNQIAEELETFIDYIKDSYVENVGGMEGTVGNEMIRSLTNIQATFKLGIPNLRSPAKNFTQSFQHFTYFGYLGMKQTRDALKDPKMSARITENLRDNAILFQNLGETWGGVKADKIFDESTGLYTEKIDVSIGEKMQRALEKTADKSLWAMTKVENAWNRKGSQEHGYVEKWKLDDGDPSLDYVYKRRMLDRAKYNKIPELRGEDGKPLIPFKPGRLKGKERQEYWVKWQDKVVQTLENQKTHEIWVGEGKVSDWEFHYEYFRRERAGKYADEVTKIIHFDYSLMAKPGLMRTKPGALVGQFKTWWINNMNYQKNIFLEGKDDIMAGMYSGDHAWRLYRMGLQNAILLGVAAPLLNVNLGALIDNNTWWNAATMGYNVLDAAGQHLTEGEVDDETKDAILAGTYSQGIIPSLMGVHAGDTLKVGSAIGLDRLSKEDNLSYLLGYDTWADLTKSEKVKELALTLHTGLSRTVTEHIPAIASGASPGMVFDREMGTKATPAGKAIRAGMFQYLGIDPKEVTQKLTKPSKEIGITYPRTESEILEMMLANIQTGGGKSVRPSPVTALAQIERLQST